MRNKRIAELEEEIEKLKMLLIRERVKAWLEKNEVKDDADGKENGV